MNPLFHTDCSISDSLKSVRKSVLIYETIIRGNGTFDKTIENIKKLKVKSNGKDVNLSFVLNQYNYKSACNIYGFVKDLGIETCFIDVIHKVGNADDNWNELGLSKEQEIEAIIDIMTSWNFDSEIMLNLRMYTNKLRDYLYKKTGIRLNDKLVWDAPGKTSLYILNDGSLLPTHFLAYMEYDKSFETKSLVDYDMKDIIDTKFFRDFMNLYDQDLPRTYYKTCVNCQYCGKQCNPSPVSYWLGKTIPMEFCFID